MPDLDELRTQVSARQPDRVGVGVNRGRTVEAADALDEVMEACGLQVTEITDETSSAIEALLEWYFSGAWREKEADEIT